MLGVPGRGAREPRHALYATVDLAYGRDGFSFPVPGYYRVVAAAELGGGRRVVAPPLVLEIEPPAREGEAELAELLTPSLGRALQLGGDPGGPELARLARVAHRGRPEGLAPWAALRLGEVRAHGFKRVRSGATRPEPAVAARWLERAGMLDERRQTFAPPARTRLLELRAQCEARAGRLDRLDDTLGELERFLSATIRTNRRLRSAMLERVRRLSTRLRRSVRTGDAP